MAAGLYGRVASRGMPSWVADGYTGEGALESQGSPQDPSHGQAEVAYDRWTIPGQPSEYVTDLGGLGVIEGQQGLSGQLVDTQHSPEGHAAPVAGPVGSYDGLALADQQEASRIIHGADFGGPGRRNYVTEISDIPRDEWTYNEPGQNVLQPNHGQMQAMGGYDIDQGYNLSNGYGFNAPHVHRVTDTTPQPMSYLDPAERPFIAPQGSGSFVPTDQVWGPGAWASQLSASQVNATPPTAYDPVPDPATSTALPAGAAPSAGWW